MLPKLGPPWPWLPKARVRVPGWRSSARVAAWASVAGSAFAGRSLALAFSLSWRNSRSRCSSFSLLKASACTCSIVSGGAVRSRY